MSVVILSSFPSFLSCKTQTHVCISMTNDTWNIPTIWFPIKVNLHIRKQTHSSFRFSTDDNALYILITATRHKISTKRTLYFISLNSCECRKNILLRFLARFLDFIDLSYTFHPKTTNSSTQTLFRVLQQFCSRENPQAKVCIRFRKRFVLKIKRKRIKINCSNFYNVY